MPTTGVSFLIHHGSHNQAVIPEFLEHTHADHPGWRVGVAVPVRRYIPSTLHHIVEQQARAAYAIADPETHVLELDYDERGAARHRYDYLQESDPLVNRSRFLANVLRAQRAAEPSTLVTPWLIHGTGHVDRHLEATLSFCREAMEELADEQGTALIGVAASAAIIADAEMRNDLLDELVELPGEGVYFRLLVTPPPSFTQFKDANVLLGLRDFVAALAANNKPALLAQIGLSGWLYGPSGSLGFGSGIKGAQQKFALGSGWGNPLEWYFVPQFLGFVLRDELPAIAEVSGFEPCPCPFCPDLLAATSWDANRAGSHYLWWCARLANHEPSNADPIKRRLSDAQEFASRVRSAGVVLDHRSDPQHLEAWIQVVS